MRHSERPVTRTYLLLFILHTVKTCTSFIHSPLPLPFSQGTVTPPCSPRKRTHWCVSTSEPHQTNDFLIVSDNNDALLEAVRSLSSLPPDATRIFHGRGNCYGRFLSQLTLDYYPPVFLLTSFFDDDDDDDNDGSDDGNKKTKSWDNKLKTYTNELRLTWRRLKGDTDDLNLVYQNRSTPKKRSSRVVTTTLSGTVPSPHVVTENGAKYIVHLTKGQNHGLFLDMANGRSWLREVVSHDTNVLNLFSYTCAFSVVALQGGAKAVVNVDMSKGGLKLGQRNHHLNGFGGGSNSNRCDDNGNQTAKFLPHDLFKSWGKVRKLGPYNVIVCDPPSYQKGSFTAVRDYGKIIRRIPGLLDPVEGGVALLCLNAPELGSDWLMSLVEKEAPEMEFVERLSNPLTFPAKDEERALKVLVYCYRPIPEEASGSDSSR